MQPYDSGPDGDADTQRIWWNDTGVHQNLTFSVQPDPISGMQCWHQRVRVTPAEADDQYGDVVVDTAKSREAYLDWLSKTPSRHRARGAPDGRLWYARPHLKPRARATYRRDLIGADDDVHRLTFSQAAAYGTLRSHGLSWTVGRCGRSWNRSSDDGWRPATSSNVSPPIAN